jgi:hypothetical protein
MLVIGKYYSRDTEDMGRVPIWKILDMNHEILLGKERK